MKTPWDLGFNIKSSENPLRHMCNNIPKDNVDKRYIDIHPIYLQYKAQFTFDLPFSKYRKLHM
jgi:hypothetical protein